MLPQLLSESQSQKISQQWYKYSFMSLGHDLPAKVSVLCVSKLFFVSSLTSPIYYCHAKSVSTNLSIHSPWGASLVSRNQNPASVWTVESGESTLQWPSFGVLRPCKRMGRGRLGLRILGLFTEMGPSSSTKQRWKEKSKEPIRRTCVF